MSDSPEQTTGLRDLHGRRLNALNKEYMLPADAPEMKRLNTQHRMMLFAMGGLYPDNYAEVIRRRLEPREGETIEIADLGSGSGDWISDMAKEFPHVQAAGMDLAPSMPNEVAPNVRFESRDVTESMAEYEGKFDMVHARSIANGVVDYRTFITSTSQLLKPGGVLMLMEGFLQIYDQELNVVPPNGGIAKLLAEVVSRQPTPSKMRLNIVGDLLEAWVKESSRFKDIKAETIWTPVGWSGSPAYCKNPTEAGRLMMDNIRPFLGAWTPMFLSMGIPEEEINQWVSDARKELEEPEKLKVYAKWIVVCAQKIE